MIPLAAIPWAIAAVAIIGGAGGTLWYRDQFHQCQLSIVTDAVKAQERARTLREADEAFTSKLEDTAKGIKDAIRDESTNTQVALAKVKGNKDCVTTPAARAYIDGVVPKPGGQAPVRK
mgnify:CR=1 FL=1